jgi:hypothetical protein
MDYRSLRSTGSDCHPRRIPRWSADHGRGASHLYGTRIVDRDWHRDRLRTDLLSAPMASRKSRG